jgi:membrane protease subunit HflK
VALYNEYIKAQDITKRRLYLETIQQTFPNLGHKYIVDSDQKNLLPLLNLGQSLNPVQQSSGEK